MGRGEEAMGLKHSKRGKESTKRGGCRKLFFVLINLLV